MSPPLTLFLLQCSWCLTVPTVCVQPPTHKNAQSLRTFDILLTTYLLCGYQIQDKISKIELELFDWNER